jgi:hypothetical protein
VRSQAEQRVYLGLVPGGFAGGPRVEIEIRHGSARPRGEAVVRVEDQDSVAHITVVGRTADLAVVTVGFERRRIRRLTADRAAC